MWIDRQDVLYAIRSARRTPLLTFVMVLALSVGIGLNAGVFAILRAGISDRPGTLPSTQKTTTRFKPKRAHSPI